MSDSGESTTAQLNAILVELGTLDVEELTDAQRIDLIAAAERVKGAAAACQARAALALAASQRDHDAAHGIRPERQGAGVPAQLGLAMRTSPARARRFLGTAMALGEMPHLRAALAAGETSEYRAFLAVRETAHLSLEHRTQVDTELAQRPGGIGSLGDASMDNTTRAIAQRLDPAGAVARLARAAASRRVSLRPAPDNMTRLSAVLPLSDGVAVYAALQEAAETARATGTAEGRARGALMADELVARVTGHSAGVPATVEIDLTMSTDTLLNTDASDEAADQADSQGDSQAGSQGGTESRQESAYLAGLGPIPADLARQIVREADQVWLRRLFLSPDTGQLVAMDSRRRLFDGALRRLVVLRDQQCRTPWCDAPIRHVDHVVPAADGGTTSADNGQGLCEACNYAKQSTSLRQRPGSEGSVETVTATGHRYRSAPPRLPGAPPPPQQSPTPTPSRLEPVHRAWLDLVLGA